MATTTQIMTSTVSVDTAALLSKFRLDLDRLAIMFEKELKQSTPDIGFGPLGEDESIWAPVAGGGTLVIENTIDVDWSKANECRSYRYPQKTSITRAILYRGGRRISKDIDRLGDFRGKAAKAHEIKTYKRDRVNLSEANEAVLVRETHGIRLWAIKPFGGKVTQYCATKGKNKATMDTFHADTERDAIKGLLAKLHKAKAAAKARDEEVLDIEIAKEKWGFCSAGCAAFVSAIGLSEEATVTFGELREIVKTKLTEGLDLSEFTKELRAAGLI